MIKINQDIIHYNHYPDGTIALRIPSEVVKHCAAVGAVITWHYEQEEELNALQFIVHHLRSKGVKRISLNMPYIPYARHDRAPYEDDLLLLRYFADVINCLRMDSVHVLDPHSSVAQNLINNIRIETPTKYIQDVYKKIGSDYDPKPLLFFPDEGAMKRYGNACKFPYCMGIKERDWVTGEIKHLSITGATTLIKGRPILIVDDICSKGGTFLHAAKALKDEHNAEEIYLWVTHCENTVHQGELLKTDYIKKIFTTNSLVHEPHKKIETISLY